MTEDVKLQLEMTEDSMKDTIEHLKKELSKLRAGKASPAMLDGIKVDYYGTLTPLKQVANVGTQDASTIVVQPWEKSMLEVINKEILKANLGFNPTDRGDILIINVPPLTEERRRELAKQVKSAGETGKISIRNARREAIDSFKAMKDDGLSEDMQKTAEADVQKLTDSFTKRIDSIISEKEAEIMKV